MASENKHYSAELKAEVAKYAIENPDQAAESIAKKYDVPVSAVLTWKTLYEEHGETAFKESTQADDGQEANTFEIELSNDKTVQSVQQGVMGDELNYKRLIYWSILGVALVIIFVQSMIGIHKYDVETTQQKVNDKSTFHDINQLRSAANKELSSYGVVDPDAGIYHIPIDTVIDEMAVDGN